MNSAKSRIERGMGGKLYSNQISSPGPTRKKGGSRTTRMGKGRVISGRLDSTLLLKSRKKRVKSWGDG